MVSRRFALPCGPRVAPAISPVADYVWITAIEGFRTSKPHWMAGRWFARAAWPSGLCRCRHVGWGNGDWLAISDRSLGQYFPGLPGFRFPDSQVNAPSHCEAGE